MMGLSSPSPSESGIFGLLSLVSDPDATKARLEELVKLNADQQKSAAHIQEAQKKLDKTHLSIKQDQEKLDEYKKQLEADKEAFEKRQKALLEELTNRESTFSKQEKDLAERSALLEKKEMANTQSLTVSYNLSSSLDKRNQELTRKEQEINEIHFHLFSLKGKLRELLKEIN